MKKTIAIFLAACIILSLAACGGSENPAADSAGGVSADASQAAVSGGNVPTIRFATEKNAAVNQLQWIRDWAAANTDKLNLVLEVESGNDLRVKLTTDMASNNLPDAWTYWSKGSLRQFTDHDLLLPIDEYLNESTEINKEDYPQYGWDGMAIDGVSYGVPYQGSTVVWFANQDLFDEYNLAIPKTYEELLACAEVFSANDIATLGVGSLHGDGIYVTFSQIFYQYEDSDSLYRVVNDKDAFAQSTGVQNASKYIVEMAQKGVFPKDTIANGSWTPCVSMYNEGKAAILPNMSWTAVQVSDSVNSVPIDCVQFPGYVNDPAGFTCGGTNNGVVVLKSTWEDSSKHDALVSFLDAYFSDDCEQLLLLDENASMKLTIDKPEELTTGAAGLFHDASASYTEQYTLVWNNFGAIQPREVFMDNLDALQALSMTPEDFIATVQSAINEELG